MPEKILYINGPEDFANLLTESEQKPVILDFWAEWCGPCQIMNPILEDIANTREDVLVAKVNVDQVQELAVAYGVQGIPTLIGFKNREEVGNRIVGAAPKAFINEHLDRLLGE